MISVNGELVDPQLVEDTFSRLKSEAEIRLQISCCERDDEFMRQAEEEVIDSILIAQEAETRYPKMPEETVRLRLEETIRQYRGHGASWDMLEAQRDQFREECEANLRMEAMVDELMQGTDEPGDDKLRQYYDDHRSELRSVPEVHCLHFVKFLEKHDDPIALLGTMRELREAALDGADFRELATRETEKESAEIDLGWIQLDRPANPFESMIFTMRDDEVSPVMSYEHAYHLVKVIESKPALVSSFDEVRGDLRERYLFDRRREALRSFAASLRETATIDRPAPTDDEDE